MSHSKVESKKIVGFVGRPSSLGGAGSFQERITEVFINRGLSIVYPEDNIVPDVIFLIGGTRKIFWLYKCKIKGAKIIHRLDGINWRHAHYNFFSKRRFVSMYRNFNVFFIRSYLSDHIVYQSDFVKNWWESEYCYLQKPSSIIRNGVDINKFYPGDLDAKEIELLIVEGNIEDDRVTEHIVFNLCNSGAVYGYQPKDVQCLTEDMAFGNIEKLNEVKKSYAYAKRDAEFAVKELGQVGLNVSIARCFSFVGKYLPRDQHFAIGNFIADGLAGRDINVKSDRRVYRSYMYADDLVKWLMTLANNSSPKCPIYNVGSDKEVEIRVLANVVGEVFNVGIQSSESNVTCVDRYIPSVRKANNELGLCRDYELNKSIIISTSDK